jgi:UDP-N-acetylmuramyl pentapeptide synthase
VKESLAGLSRALPPSMRGEIVELGGRRVIVDCYNANPASMAAALRTLAERAHGAPAIAVVGDMLELGDHAPGAHKEIGELAKQLGIKVIALGDHATTVANAAGGDSMVVLTHEDAADAALAETDKAGGWILLKGSRGMKLEKVLDAMKESAL